VLRLYFSWRLYVLHQLWISVFMTTYIHCSKKKTKGWRWFKAIWNGFFAFTWRKRRNSAKLQRFTLPWTEKYIPFYFGPAPAVKFWNSVVDWLYYESAPHFRTQIIMFLCKYIPFHEYIHLGDIVEVAWLLTRIQRLDQRINCSGITRDRANCTWSQRENTLCSRTEFTL
jgi:hypothetical protein